MTADARSFIDHLPRTPRLVDEAVSRLRDSIVDGTLPAGTRLPQVALATELNVSRTPLREALRVLESEGLLRTSDNNRTVEVVTVTADDLREMYELREVIDGLAAKLAATNGLSAEYEGRARHLLDELAESSEPYDPVRRNRAHAAFHELIAEASGNSKVRSFAPLIRTSSAVLYLPLIRETSEATLATQTYKQILDEAQSQHQQIFEAVVAGDPEAAQDAARRHIQRTLRLAPQFAAS
jgi:GntR family transcriptional regulator of vanillate catabolism